MNILEIMPPSFDVPAPTTTFLRRLWTTVVLAETRIVNGIVSGERRREVRVTRVATRRKCRSCEAVFEVLPHRVEGSRPLTSRDWRLCLDCSLLRRCVYCSKPFKAPRNAQHQITCSDHCRLEYGRKTARERSRHKMVRKTDMRQLGGRPRIDVLKKCCACGALGEIGRELVRLGGRGWCRDACQKGL
jgi:hypothetical protein